MTLKKEVYIEKYGKEAYKRMRQQARERRRIVSGAINARRRSQRRNHPEKVKVENRESSRKGGKYYEWRIKYNTTGIQHERKKVRGRHGNHYRPYKQIIAPDSQLHHEWVVNTANYRGVALVEKEPHRYGIINPIIILEGEITLLTEKEIREYTGDKK